MDREARGEPAGTPRWVKLLATLGLVAAAVVVALHLTVGAPGVHGP